MDVDAMRKLLFEHYVQGTCVLCKKPSYYTTIYLLYSHTNMYVVSTCMRAKVVFQWERMNKLNSRSPSLLHWDTI